MDSISWKIREKHVDRASRKQTSNQLMEAQVTWAWRNGPGLMYDNYSRD